MKNRKCLLIACCIVLGNYFFFFHGVSKIDYLIMISNGSTILNSIHLPCVDAFAGNETALDYLKRISFNWDQIHGQIVRSEDRCHLYKSAFGFEKSAASKEEMNFPLAYAVLAHNRFEQLLLMLSSVYEIHNQFCISIPSNADETFIILVHDLENCFPNIHVQQAGLIEWGSYEIMRATYACMEFLVKNRKKWRYFQYLSGVDAPLRTNLEMVKIFKQWNGLSHVEVVPFQEKRLSENMNKTPPIRLFKSSLSGVIAREAAEAMIYHPKARELMEYLRPTFIADESFWASALGNPDILPIKGSFNATEFVTYKQRYIDQHGDVTESSECATPPCLTFGFVGRYQLWLQIHCKGEWVNRSCVYGVSDLPSLFTNAALIAHKFYMEYEPAAFICMLKRVNNRRSSPDSNFNARQYNTLPLMEFIRGKKYENLTRPDLILKHY